MRKDKHHGKQGNIKDTFGALLSVRIVRSSLIVICMILTQSVYAQTSQIPKDTKRILFLGNSITWQGDYVAFVDTYFRMYQPEKEYQILNLGLPSETVSGLSEEGHADGRFPRPVLSDRLIRTLDVIKPDLVIACFGMNDGIYLSFDDERFEKYKNGIRDLHKEVSSRGIDIIMATPPIYDPAKGQAYANVLDLYSDWLVSQRYTEKWSVIDIHWPMRKYLETKREEYPGFELANDGVHPNELGHWLMAKHLLLGLGEIDVGSLQNIDELLASKGQNEEVLTLVRQRLQVLRDSWLTRIGHKRPGLPEGMTVKKAQQKAKELDSEIASLIRR